MGFLEKILIKSVKSRIHVPDSEFIFFSVLLQAVQLIL